MAGQDVVFPELSGGSESSPVIMDFLLLTQVGMVVMVDMVDVVAGHGGLPISHPGQPHNL